MKSFFFLFIFSLFCYSALGQFIEIKGTAPQFADEQLVIQKIENPITEEQNIVDTLIINSDGTFNQLVKIDGSVWLYINTGVFRITMLAVPGNGYEIILPPKTNKSETDIRNPFFTPLIAHIQIEKEYSLNTPEKSLSFDDINSKIFRFDTLISSMNNIMLESIRFKKKINSDSLILNIESGYQSDTSDYFRSYRKYRYGIVKINSRDVGLQHIYENYLKSDAPETDNPAYMDLFGEMYKEFLFYYSRTKEGQSLHFLINRSHDLHALIDTLMIHQAIPNENLAELIILKEIFLIYTKDYFNRESLLMILDSIALDPIDPAHTIIAKGIKKRLTRLKTGGRPPDFELLDMTDTLRSLDDFVGKYVYLNFCTPDNYSCAVEFPFLKAINNVHNTYLEIVTVMVADEMEEMKDFMKKNKYSWTCLYYGNNEKLLLDYDVRAFPTCYLIDPFGKLIQSPATLATEGFEQQLFRIMRSRGDL